MNLPDRSVGYEVVEWMEDHLVHGPGDIYGDRYRLTDEHAALVVRAYSLREDLRRQYRRVVLSRRKGFAKSELASAFTAAELLGPVRAAPGKRRGSYVGVPVTDPLIPCVATSEVQAEETLYGKFRAMVDPHLGHLLDIGLQRTHIAGRPGKVVLVSSSNVSRDGGLPTFTPCDETHLWILQELKDLHGTLRRNLVKRKDADPWMFETTTAYRPGEESVAEGSHDYGKKVANGEIRDPSLLFDHVEAGGHYNLDNEDELRAAILEASGMSAPFANVEAIVDEWQDPQVDEADFRRFWLNQVVASSSQWLAPSAWDAIAKPKERVADGTLIALGFDGSMFDDSTALIGCRLTDGHLFTLGVWEKPLGRAGAGWEAPKSEVDAAVAKAFGRFKVARFYVDPPYWQEDFDRWVRDWGDEVVVAWWTSRDRQMALALERFHTAAVTATGVSHDGDAVLARHVGNARKKEVRAGILIVKERALSPKKIDAAVAACLAYEARCDAVADGALTPPKSRVPVFH